MPELLSAFANAGLGLALGLGLLYLILRGTAWRPGGGDPVRAVRVHAMITALIALFASGTSGFHQLARLDETSYPDGLTGHTTVLPGGGERTVLSGQAAPLPWAEALVTVSGPAVSLVLIYLVAQHTWPRQTGPVRTARLADRRTAQYLPRALSVVALGVSLLAVAAVVLAWTTPAVEMQDVTESFADDYGASDSGWTDAGIRSGPEFAPWLLAALALVITGFLLVLRVVARRPPLGGLHPHDDHLVRQIAVNRALRTVVLMLWGVANAAVASWSQAYWTLAHRDPVALTGPMPDVPELVAVVQPASGITGAVLMLAMLLWRSPALRQLGDHTVTGRVPVLSKPGLGRPGTAEAVRRLRRESNTVAWITGIIAAVVAAGPMLSATVEWHPVWAGVPFAAVLAILGLYEFAIRRGHCPSWRVSPSFSGTTPRWAWWALGVSLVLAATWSVLHQSTVLTAPSGVLAVGAVACSRLALRRPPLGRAAESEDEAIRSAGAERVLAVGAAGITTATAFACFDARQAWLGLVLAGLAVVFLLGPSARAAGTEAAEPAELPVRR